MLKRVFTLALLSIAAWLSANEPVLVNNHSNLANQLIFAQNSGESSDGSESTGTISARKKKSAKIKEYRDGKSPLLASGLSLLVPGAGEMYGEDYLLGGILMGVEASLWTGYLVYEIEGDDKTKDYKTFADANFSSEQYYNAVWQMIPDTCRTGFNITHDDLLHMSSASFDSTWQKVSKSLSAFFSPPDHPSYTYSTEFTHQLPTRQEGDKHVLDKTQQYYEMIGKYHQFAAGWEDFSGWKRDAQGNLEYDAQGNPILITGRNYRDYTSNKQINVYENMRDEANQAYEVGTNFVMLAVLNRVVSAFDAAYVIKRDFTINTALRFENNQNQPGPISADNYKVSLSFRW